MAKALERQRDRIRGRPILHQRFVDPPSVTVGGADRRPWEPKRCVGDLSKNRVHRLAWFVLGGVSQCLSQDIQSGTEVAEPIHVPCVTTLREALIGFGQDAEDAGQAIDRCGRVDEVLATGGGEDNLNRIRCQCRQVVETGTPTFTRKVTFQGRAERAGEGRWHGVGTADDCQPIVSAVLDRAPHADGQAGWIGEIFREYVAHQNRKGDLLRLQ